MAATHVVQGEWAVRNNDANSDLDETQRGLIVAAIEAALAPWTGAAAGDGNEAHITWYDTQE
jgi:hypothetical protein